MIEGDPGWETWASVNGDWRGRSGRWVKWVNMSGGECLTRSVGDEGRLSVGGWKNGGWKIMVAMVGGVRRRGRSMTGFVVDTMAEVSAIAAGLVLVVSRMTTITREEGKQMADGLFIPENQQ